jgi:hypothetical protein
MESNLKNFNTILAVGAVATVCGAAEAAIVASWSMPTAIAAGTTGTSYTYGAANGGDATSGTSLSGYHALAATAWTTVAGNGSQYSFSSNTWSVGDYYQVALSTANYSDISLSWDQTRSGTGPSSFRVDMSTDGSNFTTILASYSVILAGATGSGTSSWNTTTYQSAFTNTITNIAGAGNQGTIVFRFVNLSTVAAGGTNRIDNISISGTLVPAPGAMALLGVAGLLGARRRR